MSAPGVDETVSLRLRVAELERKLEAARGLTAANARLSADLKSRTRELAEARQQQAATADVLKVISSSAFDLQSVLDTLAQSAQRLCDARGGMIFVREGEAYRLAAHVGMPDAFVQFRLANPLLADRVSAVGRVALTGELAHLPDVAADPDIQPSGPQLGEFRAVLSIPLTRDGEVVGIFALCRPTPGAFLPAQITLVQSFADQAAIAIVNVRLFNETQEALEQQKASANVLAAIGRSMSDAAPVFEEILSACQRLFGSEEMGIYTIGADEMVRIAAWRGPRALEVRRDVTPLADSITGTIIRERRTHHIPDVKAEPNLSPTVRERAQRLGSASLLYAPMLWEDRGLGSILVVRSPPKPFTERETALLRSFADQAVIAIENARLFGEVQAKTRDLEEALAQQTATADVLKVISRSVFDLDTVLQTLIDTAVRLTRGSRGTIFLRQGEYLVARAYHSHVGEQLRNYLATTPWRLDGDSHMSRAAREGVIVHIPDLSQSEKESDKEVKRRAAFGAGLWTPLMRDGEAIGVFGVPRDEPIAFSPREIELVQTFADQAVIAIENSRLFEQVQAKTEDLAEALRMQTATSEVLKVISRSAFDLQAVFNTLVTSAVELGGALTGTLCVRDGDVFRYRDTVGAEHTSALAQYLKAHPAAPGRSTIAGRVLLSGKVERVPDCLVDPEYVVPMGALASNVRSLLGVPLLRKDGIEGAIILTRAEPGEFTARQIEIVQTFADQAVIALENVRLFDEVQARTRELTEALQQQTATAEVLKVISRSAFDLQAVFDTLIRSAIDLCGAFSGSICVRDGEVFRYTGSAGVAATPGLHAYLEQHPAKPGRGTMVGRVLLSGKVEHIRDRLEDEEYSVPTVAFGNASRAFLGVPLLGKAGIEGALVLTREEPGQFTDRQIEIVQTFADQAVIAIENVRLFEEVQARTRELAASLDDLRKAQDRLVQSEKLASLGQLTAGIAHEIKNPLNFINNFSSLSRELLDELRELFAKAKLVEQEREEADELIGMVASNLDKVVIHGKRADSIVKNMLLHSREGSGERTDVNVNAMVEEALNLAYHGARAEKPGFHVTIAKSLDPNAGAAELFAQEMTRVLLNLISNAFYATTKRSDSEANGGYEPTITASTRNLGDQVEIAVRDNGTGIPEEVRAKMFNPFFTTKPAGEGTGLGLSLSHDIVVKQHGGALDVATAPGAYTEFTIRLPRAGAGK